MRALERKSGQTLRAELIRAELRRIEIMQRRWNALTVAERVAVAKISPDLSLFFRRPLDGKKPLGDKQANGAPLPNDRHRR